MNLQLLYQNSFEEDNIGFSFKVLPGAEILFADQYQIEQVLINLVKNSIEAFQKKSADKKVNIIATTYGGFVRLEVSDNGDGIPPDKMDKIFLPFFTTKESGNGIGLALSKQIMNIHKGSISIESSKGKGTLALLEIPKA